MANCARCGQCIHCASEKIALNKVWHRNCFRCFRCQCQLDTKSAKIYYGEIFCECCFPYKRSPHEYFHSICRRPGRVCSTPSFISITNNSCQQEQIKNNNNCCDRNNNPKCCAGSTKPVHSCSCIPVCCQICEEDSVNPRILYTVERHCQRRKRCEPPPLRDCNTPSDCCPATSPSPIIRDCCPPPSTNCCPSPPTNNNCCPPPSTNNCCPTPSPRVNNCCCGSPSVPQQPKCCRRQRRRRSLSSQSPSSPCGPRSTNNCCISPRRKLCPQQQQQRKCCSPSPMRRRSRCVSPRVNCSPSPCQPQRTSCCRQPPPPECCSCCCTPCCLRCGDKVYAAEKVITSCGAYHVVCFSCNCCSKPLQINNMYEACGDIYCKQCYNNYFGLNGYRY